MSEYDHITLKECAGIRDLNISTGHIYKLLIYGEDRGWISPEGVQAKYWNTKIVISGSSTICETCSELRSTGQA